MALNFDSSTMMELQTSIEHESDIHTVRLTDKYLVTCSGKVIRVFSLSDLSEMSYSPITHHKYHVISCVMSPGNRFFVCASMDGRASAIDPVTGKVITMLNHPNEVGMRACCLSNRLNGLLALGATDGLILIYDTTSFALLKSLTANNDEGINSLCFSQDNLHLISGSSSGEFRLWDALYLNETPLRTVFSAHEEPVFNITMLDTTIEKGMTSSYRFITGGGDNLIKIWKTDVPADGSKPVVIPVTTLIGHTGPVYDCVLTTDKRYLLSCGCDYTFRVWSMETFDSVYVQVGAHTKFVNGCQFTRDMRRVITAATDKLCHVWRVTDTFGLSYSEKPDLIQLSEEQVNPTNKVNMMKSLISCPITHEVMTDPVVLSDGYSYEKSAIESWLADGKTTSPMTNGPLTSLTVIPNRTLKALIQSLNRSEHN